MNHNSFQYWNRILGGMVLAFSLLALQYSSYSLRSSVNEQRGSEIALR